ncbi:hypothetical protein BGZ54_008096 [Gamsiella multidivaricata]|nr:hypothetical protein BGZ54_008096 [Gamsiella multidivaricata]
MDEEEELRHTCENYDYEYNSNTSNRYDYSEACSEKAESGTIESSECHKLVYPTNYGITTSAT